METPRDTPRSTMTDEEMIKDYPRLKREYTRLHENYREAIRKPLTTSSVVRFSECKCDEDCKQGNKK
jgi:hypothetical protein